MRQISDDHFHEFLRFYRGLALYRQLHTDRRRWVMDIQVFYGPTGTGKSLAVDSLSPDGFRLPPQQVASGCGWWDGYDGHSDVIIEEFYGQLRWSFFLQLLDRYPLSVEFKGGSCQFVGRRIFITSNKPPWEWYNHLTVGSLDPLKRRVNTIWACTEECFYKTPWM